MAWPALMPLIQPASSDGLDQMTSLSLSGKRQLVGKDEDMKSV